MGDLQPPGPRRNPQLLAGESDVSAARAAPLVSRFGELAQTAEDKRQARDALLELLADETDSQLAECMAFEIIFLTQSAEDKHQARDVLLELLARQTDGSVAAAFANGIVLLAP